MTGLSILVFSGSYLIILFLLKKIQKKNNTDIEHLTNDLFQRDSRIRELNALLEELCSEDKAVPLSVPEMDALEKLVSKVNAILKAASPEQPPAEFSLDDLVKSNEFISENTKKAFDISDNLSGSAKAAFEISEKVQNGIQTITGALSDTLEFSEVLYKQSGQISDVIEILSDISAKINLLSINASIVSARAGLHGKTFEVVAREIRKLADETNSSLSRIEEEIRDIQQVIGELVDKIRAAAAETSEEKAALISVVGTLRGITLGVEVFRAVSKLAKEKAFVQQELIQTIRDYCGRLLQRTDLLESFYTDMEREINELNDKLVLIGKPQVNTTEGKNGSYNPD